MAVDDYNLIKQAQAGVETAFSEIYYRYQPSVHTYIYFRTNDHILTDDLTAEVFVRLVDKIDTFVYQNRPLLAWLYTIAGNLVKDHYKRHNRITQTPLFDNEVDDSPSLAQLTDLFLAKDMLQEAMSVLNETQYQVIVYKFIENRTNPEVAQLLGKTEGAVKSIQHRALDTMRRYLERKGKGADNYVIR